MLYGKGLEICGARLIGLQSRKQKLWWSGNQEGYGGAGVLIKEELYDNDIEVRRVSIRVMSVVIVFEEVVRVVCTCAPQSGKSMEEKENVNENLPREWTTYHMSELNMRS